MTSLTKQRVKLNMKLLGQFTGQQPNMKEDKPTYREQFVSPQMSMISYFLMKVYIVVTQKSHLVRGRHIGGRGPSMSTDPPRFF